MKHMFLLILITGLCLGCDQKTVYEYDPKPGGPIVSGDLITVSLWEKPLDSPSNRGTNMTSGRVDIYDGFIIVTDAAGNSQQSLHGYYNKLRFRADP